VNEPPPDIVPEKVVEALPAVTTTAFWQKFCPWMANAKVKNLAIVSGTVDTALLANRILEGSVSDWMKDHLSVQVAESQCEASVDYDIEVGAVTVKKMKAVAVNARVVSTNGVSKTYRFVSSSTAGEPVPVGLAAKLFAALSIVHFEGSLVATDTDCRSDVWPGLVLNLTGGASAWATMRASVQRVDDDVDAGRTSLTFGPPNHLDATDYVTLLRASRRMTMTAKAAEKASGKVADGQELDLSGKIPGLTGAAGVLHQKDSETIGTGTKQIKLDPTGQSAYQVLTVGADGNVMQPGYVRAHA